MSKDTASSWEGRVIPLPPRNIGDGGVVTFSAFSK